MGDIAVIDYEGFVDGVAFDGGKDSGHKLTLGSGQFIPGFEEGVVGHNAGEEFDVNVTFPTEYHAENLAGKEAVFKVTLKAITGVELPELDDDFAKDVSEFDTFDEYKADVKAKLIAKHEKEADNVAEEALINALLEKLEAEIPQAMFDTEVENEVRDYETRLRMNGLNLDTYFKYTGMTMEQLRAQMAPQAERQVKTRLALEKIAALENLEASDEDVAKEYEDIAKAWGRDVEEVKKTIPTASIVEDMKVKKAIELVKATAVITVDEGTAEAPATETAE
jgi:trigger factor